MVAGLRKTPSTTVARLPGKPRLRLEEDVPFHRFKSRDNRFSFPKLTKIE
jgi:hypothetical protein